VSGYLGQLQDYRLKDSTIKTKRTVIVCWLRWLSARQEAAECDWQRAVEKIRVDESDPRCLSVSECNRLLDTCLYVVQRREQLVKKRDVAMIALMLDTALREGEMARLRIRDVDMKEHCIVVSAECKGRRERHVWFGERTAKLLKSYLSVHPTGRLDDALWHSRRNHRLSGHRIYTTVKEIAELAGLEGVTAHCLRHTCATLLLNNGLPLEDLRRLLGHSSIATTQRYVHLVDADVAARYRAASPLDRLTSES